MLILAGVGIGLTMFFFSSFKTKTATPQYVVINALESVVEGGAGRSRCHITYPDGKQEEFNLDNYYSLVGVNFGNIKDNDKKLAAKINELASNGYQMVSQASGGAGIYSTRIIMVKQ